MNESDIQVSVVIAFKDWGADRLRASVLSILGALDGTSSEIIVSDYGSADPTVVSQLAHELGFLSIYTKTDGIWARSRAMNIGLGAARGRVMVCTDADMLFSPGSLMTIADLVEREENATVLLECRDLPQGWTEKRVLEEGANWAEFESTSRLRGRWGMGGMIAVRREMFTRVRGLDERMHTYGCEDIDFGERTQRAGNRIVWISDPKVRMYHMWHEKSHVEAYSDMETLAAVDDNRKILYGDPSYIRNSTKWLGATTEHPPLVTVAIATMDRPELLREALLSVLTQTMQDFEIVVGDDGSSDRSAERVIEELGDKRIRYFFQENGGIAKVRNAITDVSRGTYLAVLDDDDLMLPWRLEKQIRSIRAGVHGSYGAFVNFEPSGEMKIFNEKDVSIATAFENGGAPGHSTWLVETNLMKTVRYDETIYTGEDNNLFLRLLRSGARFAHCGDVATLRRVHRGQITLRDNQFHVGAARRNRRMFRFGAGRHDWTAIEQTGAGAPWVQVPGGRDYAERVRPFLPDELVDRAVVARIKIDPEVQVDALPKGFQTLEHQAGPDGMKVIQLFSHDCSYEDMAKLHLYSPEFVSATVGTTMSPRDTAIEEFAEEYSAACGDQSVLVIGTTRRLDFAVDDGTVTELGRRSIWIDGEQSILLALAVAGRRRIRQRVTCLIGEAALESHVVRGDFGLSHHHVQIAPKRGANK